MSHLNLGDVVVVEGRPLEVLQTLQVGDFTDVLTVEVQGCYLWGREGREIMWKSKASLH